ncbi:hypothetical protein [Metabacillus litoralis]|uniref:hypothetical protein n=1 Tax=Metabacillus litoralis TaxID=152268 RepID=UPI00203FDB74|nr:hypothetical protein [Metabacillus litoralis]
MSFIGVMNDKTGAVERVVSFIGVMNDKTGAVEDGSVVHRGYERQNLSDGRE